MATEKFLFGTVGSPLSTPKKPGGTPGGILRMHELGLTTLELAWVQSVRVGDDDQDRQYRAFLSFDTRSLPDNAVIDSVILRLKKTTGAGVSPFKTHGDLMVDITKPYFGPAKSLQIGDFQAAGTVSGKVNPTPVNALYLAVLPRPAFTLINPAGYTQIRLRFKLGDNDNMVANYLSFFSGNATNPNVRPVLVIVYHLP